MTTKSAPPQLAAFQTLIKSRAYAALTPTQKLDAMLAYKSFEQLLNDGDILDVKGASQRSGYTPQHVRRLCREDRLDHIRRGLVEEEVHFYFLPSQIASLFSSRNKTSRA
jgi:hypothetical protein